MRLTLRTLLAYLDDILEPADAEDISRKIEDSERATSVVTRIRDVTRRLRLSAPKLEGRGTGLDPNTVAEYLDNTLSTERVPDFEKVCLESDVQLAEVASCHQILTLVLGAPAEVEPQSRQRMYELVPRPGLTVESPDDQSVPHPKSAEVLAAHEESPARRPKPEVPGYLRDDRSRRSRILAIATAVALVVLLAASAFFAIRPLRDELASSEASQQDVSAPGVSKATEDTAAPSESEASIPAGRGSEPTDQQIPGTPEPVVEEGPLEIPEPQPDSPPDAVEASPPSPAAPEPAEISVEPPATPDAEEVGPEESDSPQTTDSNADAPGVPDTDEPPALLGRFITPSEVLIRYDVRTNDWRRLPPNEIVYPGDTLLVLPDFRPTITLGTGIGLQLQGGTRVTLDEVETVGLPSVTIAYGRIILMTVGRGGARLHLQAGSRDGILIFEDPESTVAIDVRPYRVGGTDPEEAPSRLAVDLYVTGGRIRWEDSAGGDAETLQAPAVRRLQAPAHDAGAETAIVDESQELPSWVSDLTPLSLAQRRAADDLSEQLVVDRSVRLTLRELAQHRRSEIRALATRGLTYLDEFGPVVEAFNERRQKVYWNEHVESLRVALARGADVAAQVRESLSKHYPSGGEELYRMLWGYSETQLREGDDAKLVDYLEHKNLPFNIFAFWNLRGITGKSLHYRPQDKPADRQQALRRWRQELDEGLIVPRAPSTE